MVVKETCLKITPGTLPVKPKLFHNLYKVLLLKLKMICCFVNLALSKKTHAP